MIDPPASICQAARVSPDGQPLDSQARPPTGLVHLGVLCLIAGLVSTGWGVYGLLVKVPVWPWFVIGFLSGCAGIGLIRIGVWTDWIRVRVEILEQRERERR